jgi:hypothetical protein
MSLLTDRGNIFVGHITGGGISGCAQATFKIRAPSGSEEKKEAPQPITLLENLAVGEVVLVGGASKGLIDLTPLDEKAKIEAQRLVSFTSRQELLQRLLQQPKWSVRTLFRSFLSGAAAER